MNNDNPVSDIIGDVLAGSIAALLTPLTYECEELADYVVGSLKKSRPQYAARCDQVVAAKGREAKLEALDKLRAEMPGDMSDAWVGSVELARLEIRASLKDGRRDCSLEWKRR